MGQELFHKNSSASAADASAKRLAERVGRQQNKLWHQECQQELEQKVKVQCCVVCAQPIPGQLWRLKSRLHQSDARSARMQRTPLDHRHKQVIK